MEASELRSGVSLVYLNEQVCVVNSVNEHGSIRLTPYTENPKWKYESFSVNGGAVQPITLTEDILVKCGFDFSKNRYSPRIGKFVLETGDDGYIIFIIDDYIKIKHLHQLQNLYFALTGEELNIEL